MKTGKNCLVFIPVLVSVCSMITQSYADCISVTCFDGSVHPCGFDCSSLAGTSGGGGVGSSGSWGNIPSGPSAEEIARQKRWKQSYDLNEEGNGYFEAGNFEKAAECYRKALEIDPDRPVIRENLNLAEQYIAQQIEQENIRVEEKRKLDEAKGKVNNMLDSINADFDGSGKGSSNEGSAESAESLEFIGLNEPLFSKGTVTSAPPDFRSLDTEDSKIIDPRVVKGQMTPEEAARAREKDEKFRTAAGSASACIAKGDYDSAINHLKEALKLKPDDREIQKEIGYVLYLKDKREGRIVSNPKVEVMLDALEVGRGDWQVSIDYLQITYSAEPENLAYRDAFRFLQGLSGFYDDRVKIPQKPTPPRNDKVRSLLNEGLRLIGEKDYEHAVSAIKEAHKIVPDDLGIRDMVNFTEGLDAAQNTKEVTGVKGIFAPSPKDSEALLPAVAGEPEK